MTIEEAIRLLDPEINMKAIEAYEGMESYAIDEACKVVISALRAQQTPLDRSRWEGCKYCENTLKNYRYINDCDIEKRSLIYDRPKYCPRCGRPLTEDAWAELERRINGGTTD